MYPRDNLRVKTLTRDTATALSHSCMGLIELFEHLLTKEHYNYVMLGNFTSDPIEKVRKATARLRWSIFHYDSGNIREDWHQVYTIVSKLQ